jgi:hypothetical protein
VKAKPHNLDAAPAPERKNEATLSSTAVLLFTLYMYINKFSKFQQLFKTLLLPPQQKQKSGSVQFRFRLRNTAFNYCMCLILYVMARPWALL